MEWCLQGVVLVLLNKITRFGLVGGKEAESENFKARNMKTWKEKYLRIYIHS